MRSDVKFSKEMFRDVIIFSVSESDANIPNIMTFYRATGESFSVDCTQKERYEGVKEVYPILKKCYWNGPMKNEVELLFLGVPKLLPGQQFTTVPERMRHIYLNCGNHLVVQEEYYYAVRKILKGKSDEDIISNWTNYLDEADFVSQLDECQKSFYQRKERDQKIIKKIEELNQLPEYRKKIKACDGVDSMLDVCKEYGLEIDEFELKVQFLLSLID